MLGFWRVPDCEELVGGFTGDDGVGFNVVSPVRISRDSGDSRSGQGR